MRNFADESCRGNRNTHFIFSALFFLLENRAFFDNVEKICRAEQATDDSMVRAYCTMDN